MFGPLICGKVAVAGVQNGDPHGGNCTARLSCFDLSGGRKRWQQDYASPDMWQDIQKGPEATLLLTKYRGGALMVDLQNGKVIRQLGPTEVGWRAIAANERQLFCGRDATARGGQNRGAVVAYDGRALQKRWQYELPQARWRVVGLHAGDGTVEAAVGEEFVSHGDPPSIGKTEFFLISSKNGRLTRRSPYATLNWQRENEMRLPDGSALVYGGGNASHTAFYEEAREQMTRRVRWRLAYEGLHDSVLVPPLMLVAYGENDWTEDTRSQGSRRVGTLLCLDAATGHVKWQAALEPGTITLPQVLAPTDPPPHPDWGTPPTPPRLGWHPKQRAVFILAGVVVLLLVVFGLRGYRRSKCGIV